MDLDGYEVLIKALETTNSDISACGLQDEYHDIRVNKCQNFIPEATTWNGKDELVTAFFTRIGGWAGNKVYRREIIGDTRYREDIYQAEDTLFSWEVFKKAHKVCYTDLPLYHYRYSFVSATKSADISRLKTALVSWELIKEDLNSKKVPQTIVERWARNYIVWNIKLCERMLFSPKPDMATYKLVQRNIGKYKAFILSMGIRHRILAKSILQSWNAYKTWGRLFYRLKQFYVDKNYKR